MAIIETIVAHDQMFCIGIDGKIPWDLPEDHKLFREITMGHILVIGRKTWETLPKGHLDGRCLLVVTQSPNKYKSFVNLNEKSGVPYNSSTIFVTWEQAISFFEVDSRKTFIAGGEEIYKLAARDLGPKVSAAHISVVKKAFKHNGKSAAYWPNSNWMCPFEITKRKEFDDFNYFKIERREWNAVSTPF